MDHYKLNEIAKPDSTTVITVNHRLADYLSKQYSSPPFWDILPLETWIQRCWQSTADKRVILKDFQEKIIFKQIIKEVSLDYLLININATAEAIQQACRLMRQWELTIGDLCQKNSIDTLYFIDIYKKFTDFLKINDCIDSAYLPTLLQESIKNQKVNLPQQLLFVGFEQFSPQLLALINVLKQHIKVNFIENTLKKADTVRIGITDRRQEIYTMARWAKQQVAQNPSQVIGCVVPDLVSLRDTIETIFMEVFYPESALSFNNLQKVFNFSAGKALSLYPLVNSALEILKLSQQSTVMRVNFLLHSPFLKGSETEFIERNLLSKQLQEIGEMETSLRMILSLARSSTTRVHCPILANLLQAFLETLKNIPDFQLPSGWAQSFQHQLQIVGWPGERSLNSDEYQILQRWQELLAEFSLLDAYLEQINITIALDLLEQLAAGIMFQPKTADAPVQILGILEAANLPFDHLWVMGLTEQAWPPQLTPNSYLPLELQRKKGMPHAAFETEWDFYKKLTERFRYNVNNVILSYPLWEEDRALKPSPLIIHFPEIEELKLDPHISINQLIFNSRNLEIIEDEKTPVLNPNETIRGGSAIFKFQAACPFSAFAKFRLKAEGVTKPQLGLNYIERGILLHTALEKVWNIISNQQQLKSLHKDALEDIINQSVNSALLEHTKRKPLTLKKYFAQIERQRLKKLISRWLEIEKNRPSFNVVAKEQVQKITLGNIPMQIRIDRIDQLADGTHLIIDYKTGKTSTDAWFGPNPDEPQLPLYCINSSKTISGLAFAQVRIDDMRFNEISANNTPHWPMLVEEWKIVLTQLANDFSAGKAQVTPKDIKKTCQYCDLKSLCRIYERN